MNFRRKKRKMSDVWWDAHWTDYGVAPYVYKFAQAGDERAQRFIERYEAAKTRTEARRAERARLKAERDRLKPVH